MRKMSIREFFIDVKYLIKGFVLVANILPILSGFWLALYFSGASFSAYVDKFIYLTVGGTLVMAGALMLNNWYEVDLDREMGRTQRRPTVTGSISLRAVLTSGIVCSVLGMGILFLTTFETVIYAFIGWFTYVVLYTFWTKRRYTLNTVVGSVSGAVTPLMGWAVISSTWHVVPIALALILFIWQVPHTFAIAMRRVKEYSAAKVPMLPVVYGFEMTKRVTALYVFCLIPVPMMLTSLGMVFIVIITVLNMLWAIAAIWGIFMKDDVKYANMMFYSSLVYLTIVFGSMIVISLF